MLSMRSGAWSNVETRSHHACFSGFDWRLKVFDSCPNVKLPVWGSRLLWSHSACCGENGSHSRLSVKQQGRTLFSRRASVIKILLCAPLGTKRNKAKTNLLDSYHKMIPIYELVLWIIWLSFMSSYYGLYDYHLSTYIMTLHDETNK